MELKDIIKKYNYNESLGKLLNDIFKYVLETRNDTLKIQFLKCLERVEIILTNNIGEEFDKRYRIPLATKFFLANALGQYWIMPEILKGTIERKVFVRVADINNLTEQEQENLTHELVHLFRSYGLGEILYDENSFKIVSGVKKSTALIVDNKLDLKSLIVKNEQLEERFVVFLSKYFDFLTLTPENINIVMDMLVKDLEIEEEYTDEKMEIFLNMLIIKYFYNGDITKCLLPDFANFLEEAKKEYDIFIVKTFVNIYQNKYNNKQELLDLFYTLETKRQNKFQIV